jgi:hypothetical protein
MNIIQKFLARRRNRKLRKFLEENYVPGSITREGGDVKVPNGPPRDAEGYIIGSNPFMEE